MALFSCYGTAGHRPGSPVAGHNPNDPPIVLELFTSQGCSSCPPADRLLEKLAGDPGIIALSFHVDYWNRLGWRDPFSSPEFSRRQMSYAGILKSDVYTPQLVIDGETEMVGSDSVKIAHAIGKMRSRDMPCGVTIQSIGTPAGHPMAREVRFTLSGSVNGSVAHIALVRRQAITAVKAGENSGRTLTDGYIVRVFSTLHELRDGENSMTVDLPEEGAAGLQVVVYLQQPDLKILAADRKDL